MKTKTDLIMEFAQANGIEIAKLEINDPLVPKLSESTRDEIYEYLVSYNIEIFEHEDIREDTILFGWEGLTHMSDDELVKELESSVDLNDLEADNTKLYHKALSELAVEDMLREDS